MDIILQIISGVAVAAITGGIVYLYRLDKKLSNLENRIVQVGDVRFPKTTNPRAYEFFDGRRDRDKRELPVPVTFDVPFRRQPKVVVSLQKIDLGDAIEASIHRIAVRAENVRLTGFDLYFETWKESQVYDAVASWVAVGE